MKHRTCPDLSIENTNNGIVCGLDEAGRAPLAGPVVAACVHIPEKVQELEFWAFVNDSKKLSLKKRESLFAEITVHCAYGIAEGTLKEIEELNILWASMRAMEKSLDRMTEDFGITPDMALIDGNRKPKNLPCPAQPVIKGDQKSLSIAAASILAKVTRDRIMRDLCTRFPYYGWSRNAGYPTQEHMDAINKFGITDHHRRSFAPVRDYLNKQSA